MTLHVPSNAGGLGYVCYSAPGIAGGFSTTPTGVTQVFEGAQDLDIKPADNQSTVRVSRIWVAAGSQISATLDFDDPNWTAATQIVLTLLDPCGATLATKTFASGSSGDQLIGAAVAQGWYTFEILSRNTPASNPKPAYKLTVSYTAPQASTLT